MTLADNTVKKQRGRPFKKGTSPNPSGRPQGALNKSTLAIQALLDGEAETITRKAIEMALAGDVTAMRLVLERILPPRKEIPIQIDLAPIHTAADTVEATAAVINAVATGEITPSQGQTITAMIGQLTHAIGVQNVAVRLETLEQRVAR